MRIGPYGSFAPQGWSNMVDMTHPVHLRSRKQTEKIAECNLVCLFRVQRIQKSVIFCDVAVIACKMAYIVGPDHEPVGKGVNQGQPLRVDFL
jgi:hypothetical protein